MSAIAARLNRIETIGHARAQDALMAFSEWLEGQSEDDRRAYWRWICTPFAAGAPGATDLFDAEDWGGVDELMKWINENGDYKEERDTPVLLALGKRTPPDLRRRTVEAWRFAGAIGDCLDWLEVKQ